MAKTVAQRAAELGTDKITLVRALRVLSHRELFADTKKKHYGHRQRVYYGKKALMTFEAAASSLGLDVEDAKREVKAAMPIDWTVKLVLDGLFAFHKEHGRWPKHKEIRRSNGLPSHGMYGWLAWSNQGRFLTPGRVSPRDWWEREIAKDGRCTPEMALTLRNVLARKTAIDRLGFHNFIKRGLAEEIDSHPEYGTLYSLPGETPTERMVLLKVVNSTPEADGSFADYYLRVPPDQNSVREALAWTFNGNEALGSQPYAPLIET